MMTAEVTPTEGTGRGSRGEPVRFNEGGAEVQMHPSPHSAFEDGPRGWEVIITFADGEPVRVWLRGSEAKVRARAAEIAACGDR